MKLAWLGAALWLLAACRTHVEPQGGGQIRGAFPTTAVEAKPLAPAQPLAPAPEPLQPSAQPSAQPTAAPEQPAAEKPKRDYSAELLSAMGSPTDCLAPREAADNVPSEISVELEGFFLETGSMSRGYARSPQLDASELDCMRRRLEAVHLQPPIEGAPRAITTSLKLTLKISEKTAE